MVKELQKLKFQNHLTIFYTNKAIRTAEFISKYYIKLFKQICTNEENQVWEDLFSSKKTHILRKCNLA